MKRLARSIAVAAAVVLAACMPTRLERVPTTDPDYAREERWAAEVVPGVVVGDPVKLEAEGRPFLALYTPSAGRTKGSVILVHGMGVHPDFGVIGTLRADLADLGYATLSIQMPVLAAGEPAERYVGLFTNAAERLTAAVRYMNERGHRRPAVVSHSMGARMANFWISRNPTQPISAWVPLSISSGELEALRGLPVPVFDVYAEKDFDVIRKNAGERAAVLRNLPGSKQVVVFGTDHFYAGKEKELAILLDQLLAPLYR